MSAKLLPCILGAALAMVAAPGANAAPAASPAAPPPAKMALPATSPPATMPTGSTTATAPAKVASSSAVFPAKINPKYASQSAGQGRMHTCLDQYKANKAANANGGMTWIQKGGGYYPMCTKKLKG